MSSVYPHVQSFSRGLSVIKAFDHEHAAMTLTEISQRTGLSRSTSRRFLLTLLDLGYARSDGRLFSLTPGILELGFSYLSSLNLPEICQPHLRDLSATANESTSLSVLDGTDIVYVARVHTRRIMTVRINVGTRFPAYATSMGRVLLSALESSEVEQILDRTRLEAFTTRTLRSRRALLEELERVREQGWALIDQELEEGLRSVAAPVRHHGRTVAAVNISTSSLRHPVESILGTLLPTLLDAKDRMSKDVDDSRPFSEPALRGFGPPSSTDSE
ncbi:MAG: helix-turn-helix domain-containing protein [Propionibacteriales bacterium]|nr:helix-turn-helix domain-containing protein [Propionibacteriales bacterium]